MDAFLNNFGANEDAIARARKPVVAAVAGFALGGGCELAMQCDLIIAADNAKFGQPEIKLGVIPGIGGTQRLTRAVGKAKAMDMILTGRMMDAAEAERSGLVARVVPAASLMDEAMKVAETIAAMSLPSVLAAKEAVNRAFEATLAEGVLLRAPRVPCAVRDRRPEGRHGRLRREAPGEVQEQIIGKLFPHADHAHDGVLGAVEAGAAGGGRHIVRVEETAEPRDRHQHGGRRAGRTPATIDDPCTAMPSKRPRLSSAAAPEKPGAGAVSSALAASRAGAVVIASPPACACGSAMPTSVTRSPAGAAPCNEIGVSPCAP